MIHVLQEGVIQVDSAQHNWIVQEDPRCASVPAGPNEEIKTAMPSFPWASEQRRYDVFGTGFLLEK